MSGRAGNHAPAAATAAASAAAAAAFREDAPRPPVPGEETTTVAVGACVGQAGLGAGQITGGGWVIGQKYAYVAPTPRRCDDVLAEGCGAPLGFEPEGSPSSPFLEAPSPAAAITVPVNASSGSPPACLRWARNLHALLEDPEGVSLFRRFLEQEGPAHADALDFWFACEGLKKQRDPERIHQLVKVIHRRFFVKTQLAVGEELRKDVNRKVKEGASGHVFDHVQAKVEQLITETTYPEFLRGDLYLHHVQAVQAGEPCSSGSSSSGGGSGGPSGLGGPLPPLPEDAELPSDPLPLTRDSLLATQRRRHELRPRPEAFAGLYLHHGNAPHPHLAYSSYNPVSRQDSELQSLSSEARTESDNMSLTDSSVDGGASGGRAARAGRRQQLRLHGRTSRDARERDGLSVNRDPLHHAVIPRTQRLQKEQLAPLSPSAFAQLLIDKLEAVRREQEAQDKLHLKLHEGETAVSEERSDGLHAGPHTSLHTVPQRSLQDAIRDKLLPEDDSDQAILDQHVSRVWSDLTPARSPGLASPRPRSPEGRRQAPYVKSAGPAAAGVHPPHSLRPSHCPRHHNTRKEKDVFSTFSSDSGNVHDFPEGPDLRHHMPKSKSMPLDYQDPQKPESFPLQAYDARFRQSRDGSRRSSSKKTVTDLTDSGVSVVSDSAPVAPLSQSKDSRVLSWLLESEKEGRDGPREGQRHSRVRCQPSVTSPAGQPPRHGRRPAGAAAGGSGSRSGSLERLGGGGPGAWGGSGAWGGPAPAPAQPFVADPCMPPLPTPHTDSQLEEARRRLLLEASTRGSRHGGPKPCAHLPVDPLPLPLACASGPPTLRRSKPRPQSQGGPAIQTNECRSDPIDQASTTVVFSFCDEQFPYRTKIPGRAITLRQFKEFLPKKGNYRFFFKMECEDLETRVIQEEVTDDSEVLPLWEGKVMAQVKPID